MVQVGPMMEMVGLQVCRWPFSAWQVEGRPHLSGLAGLTWPWSGLWFEAVDRDRLLLAANLQPEELGSPLQHYEQPISQWGELWGGGRCFVDLSPKESK